MGRGRDTKENGDARLAQPNTPSPHPTPPIHPLPLPSSINSLVTFRAAVTSSAAPRGVKDASFRGRGRRSSFSQVARSQVGWRMADGGETAAQFAASGGRRRPRPVRSPHSHFDSLISISSSYFFAFFLFILRTRLPSRYTLVAVLAPHAPSRLQSYLSHYRIASASH